ncbi:MAG: nucleoside-triphosphatase, partial [Thermodesulfobacteriota bacterium]
GVNLNDIDSIAVPAIVPAGKDETIVIDEIGRMERFSLLFRDTLISVLNMPHWILGSIALKGDHFIQQIRERRDVHLIRISAQNRDMLVERIINYTQLEKHTLIT